MHWNFLFFGNVSTQREPFKLNGRTLNVLLCSLIDSKRCIVSWALKSHSPKYFIISRLIAMLELLPKWELLMTELKMSFNCIDFGSPFAAYFARYSTQAWWSIIIWISQLTLHPWSWMHWWLFNRGSFLLVTTLALYWTVLSFVVTFSNSNLVLSQRLNGKLKQHSRSDSFCLCLRQWFVLQCVCHWTVLKRLT